MAGRISKVLPPIAAAVLAALLLSPLVVACTDDPPEVETAVKSEWHGGTYPFGFGMVRGQESAEEVRCEETDATVAGARAHECTIVHYDYNETDGIWREARTSACAALVSGELVMVSRDASVGPAELQEELDRNARC